MAIIACPYCGKRVTDRMVTCPHCQTALTQQPEQKPITPEKPKVSAKDRILSVVMPTIFLMIVVRIWRILASVCVGRLMGDVVLAALGCAGGAFYFSTFVLLLIEAVLLYLQPSFFKRIPLPPALLTVITSVVFAVLGWLAQYHAPLLFVTNRMPEVLHYSRTFAFALGAGFPLLWGSFYIATQHRTFKKALLMHGLLSVAFLVLSTVLEVLLCVSFAMGTQGFSVANLISALVVLAIALFTSKDFQKLIQPKGLA